MSEQVQPAPDPEIGKGGAKWHGDAFDLTQRLPDESVDLVLTSPPYWGLRTYGQAVEPAVLEKWTGDGLPASRTPPYDWYREAGGILGLEPYPQWYIDHLVEWFGRARRVLAQDGSLWINLGDTYFARWSSIRDGGRQGLHNERVRRKTPSGGYLHDKQLLLIPARFAIAMQDAGWILRNDLIWAKSNVMPRPEPDRLRLAHEHWFHFVKRSPRGRPSYYYNLAEAEATGVDVVQTAKSRGADGHTATFPQEIIRPRISSSCRPGGLVLDPFCGTGTTIDVAVSLGRRGLGFEITDDEIASVVPLNEHPGKPKDEVPKSRNRAGTTMDSD